MGRAGRRLLSKATATGQCCFAVRSGAAMRMERPRTFAASAVSKLLYERYGFTGLG